MVKIRNIVLILALLSVVSLVSYKIGESNIAVPTNADGSTSTINLNLMNQVRSKLKSMYIDSSKMNDRDMSYGAISGMVGALGDPYTVFLPPKDNKSSTEDLAGEFGGVGISLGYKDKTLAVQSPLTGTPADKAGIKAGDLILKITDKAKNIDKDTTDMSLSEAVDLIRGKVGTEVTLKMFRDGDKETKDVVLTRDNIVVPNLQLTWKEQNGKKAAWVQLNKFTDTLYTEWPAMVSKIKNEKHDGIVLDLRNNPGGFLQASVMIASDFLNDGIVVSQESANGQKQVYNVDPSRRQLVNDKLVVLVNGGSASAAEILAGALKDHNRAKLVGENTFGKGTVQQPIDFSDGSGLHVTIARWLLPSGKNIHKVGVAPDVEIKADPNNKDDVQLNKAMEVLFQ